MRALAFSLLGLGLLAGCQSTEQEPLTTSVMPESVRQNVVEDLHGTKVADPYRWLEDLDSPETADWVKRQQQYSNDYLSGIDNRDVIEQRITQLWNYERLSAPFIKGDYQFFYRNDGLQSQSVLYRANKDGSNPQVALDPNTLSADGTVALSGVSISKDGRWLAYGTSESGSDWQQWQFLDLSSGQPLTDTLEWIKFSSASWDKEGKGVWYSRYDAPKAGDDKMEQANYFQKVFYHRLGTDQSEDVLVYERKDQKDWGFGAELSDDGKYLLIYVSKGTDSRNLFFYQDLATGKTVELISEFEAEYGYLGNDDSTFYFQTNYQAPQGRIIAIDVNKPEKANWKELVPESKNTLASASLINDHFVVRYMKDVLAQVSLFDLNGKHTGDLSLPGAGSVNGISGERKDTSFHFLFNSYIQPTAVYRYDFASNKVDSVTQPDVAFDPKDYVSEQVFYTSKDGTRVPMMISYKKGLKRSGDNPTLLYAYGGFNISLTPRFSPATIAWLDMGGVYAVPNLRGGAEYGEKWHQQGMLERKQNVFDDYYAAAEYLIDNGFTNSDKMGAYGRSNGGLLMGAALTQRPDLFAAVLPAVGVLDMLRYQKFTIGWAWTPEYGSADNKADFEYLYAYSPLHNVAKRDYPATMVMTADHDDRVVPSHSFKFAAEVQHQQQGPAPVIARIETKAGHGAGKPTSMRIAEYRDIYAFLWQNFGLEIPKTIN
ncbi:prolyl oligopeptidase family serine peptidase [Ferrimonas aestuarii]|uniref:prolyl oligopeptidase n=1 Tax=Ferrimonas aestuarii TaxID=2569539 RepID=A0A4U1BRX9_9GAMM|nr:prolyl oligopeptidase family serine peptidase [Ferrimonas aestuarii]TKB54599.1 S9 family peptidase [Ferrimonas aestuarii]